MVLGSGSTHHPTMENAQDLMQDMQQRFPDYAVHIFNLTEPQFENRFMLQNDLSRLCFGRITREDGGLKNKLIDWTAAWRAMRVFENSFTNKGTAYSTSYKMHFIGPEEGMINTLERQVWIGFDISFGGRACDPSCSDS